MDINTLGNQLLEAINLFKANFELALIMVGCLWLIQIVNVCLDYRLNIFGIYPRKPWSLLGLVFSPLLHGSFNHLFFNSIPLFILIDFALLDGIHQFICVTSAIALLGGLGVWLFGRPGFHVGASSLVMGYWGYLLMNAYKHPSGISIALGIVCLYYFGSLLFSLFPSAERTSWEGHVFGFLAGIAAVYLCPLGMFF